MSGHSRAWVKQEVEEPSRLPWPHPWDIGWRLGTRSNFWGSIVTLATGFHSAAGFLSRRTDRGKEGIKSGQERERKKKKIGKARTFLEALWPLSLQPPERRRRRETKQKAQEKNEPKQHQHEGCVVQSKQRRDATGQAPSQKAASFRRTRGSCRKRWPFMARRGGPWRGSLPY